MKPNKWTGDQSAENITALLDRLEVTTTEFANIVGTGVNVVSIWINGHRKPRAKYWRQFNRLEAKLNKEE